MFPKNTLRIAVGLFLLFFVVFVIFYGQQDWFGTGYPASVSIREYYLTHALAGTGAENAVTAVYLDYRLFATLFETMLLFARLLQFFTFPGTKEIMNEHIL